MAARLAEDGRPVCSLSQLAETAEARVAFDAERESWEVDLARLKSALPPQRPLLVEGHLSHRMGVDLAVVLRCHPEVLRRRLQARDWPDRKVRENVEAEAVGVILEEARGRCETYEVDTTHRAVDETVEVVGEILDGGGEAYRPGRVDWSEVVLGWY